MPATTHGTIQDAGNAVIVSATTAWEITTKHLLGKLPEAAAVTEDVAGAIAA